MNSRTPGVSSTALGQNARAVAFGAAMASSQRPGVRFEDSVGGAPADASAAELTKNEELGDGVFDGHAAMRMGVDEGEARCPAVDLDQEGAPVGVAPVAVDVIIGAKTPFRVELPTLRLPRIQLREVVNVELEEAFNQRPLFGPREPDRHHHERPGYSAAWRAKPNFGDSSPLT